MGPFPRGRGAATARICELPSRGERRLPPKARADRATQQCWVPGFAPQGLGETVADSFVFLKESLRAWPPRHHPDPSTSADTDGILSNKCEPSGAQDRPPCKAT